MLVPFLTSFSISSKIFYFYGLLYLRFYLDVFPDTLWGGEDCIDLADLSLFGLPLRTFAIGLWNCCSVAMGEYCSMGGRLANLRVSSGR